MMSRPSCLMAVGSYRLDSYPINYSDRSTLWWIDYYEIWHESLWENDKCSLINCPTMEIVMEIAR